MNDRCLPVLFAVKVFTQREDIFGRIEVEWGVGPGADRDQCICGEAYKDDHQARHCQVDELDIQLFVFE